MNLTELQLVPGDLVLSTYLKLNEKKRNMNNLKYSFIKNFNWILISQDLHNFIRQLMNLWQHKSNCEIQIKFLIAIKKYYVQTEGYKVTWPELWTWLR